MVLPKLPLGALVDALVQWATINLAGLFNIITIIIDYLVGNLRDALLYPPSMVVIALTMALVWFIAGRKIAIGTGIGLLLIDNLGLWRHSMETLALVLSATLITLLIALPLGVLTARSDFAHKMIMPVLDFMQTMPPFVYLIPAVFFFNIGNVPGLIATIIFAMPPAIRLTGLGIRQVPEDLVEAATAFGSTPGQKLFKVQLPLAMPTIMAGVNQCIMLSLSMVVIAAMIGAGGLGYVVLSGIMRLDIAMGFEGGLAIVIIAIILDRITQSLTNKRKAVVQS